VVLRPLREVGEHGMQVIERRRKAYGVVGEYLARDAHAGGVAVAAPERGALGGPSAPTSTSTRWALVAMQTCHAWYGRGLNEAPAAAGLAVVGKP
jgi:hypothetical protein